MITGHNMVKGLVLGMFGMLVLTYCAPVKAQTHKQEETECLANNMYWEARNQSIQGMIAVGYVTMNRVLDERYPNTVCQVVYQGQHSKWFLKTHQKWHPLKHRCQFSWYCDGKKDVIPKQDAVLYDSIKTIAAKIVYGYNSILMYDFTKGATHYHADYVSPDWASKKTQTATIGKHIFYRWEKR